MIITTHKTDSGMNRCKALWFDCPDFNAYVSDYTAFFAQDLQNNGFVYRAMINDVTSGDNEGRALVESEISALLNDAPCDCALFAFTSSDRDYLYSVLIDPDFNAPLPTDIARDFDDLSKLESVQLLISRRVYDYLGMMIDGIIKRYQRSRA